MCGELWNLVQWRGEKLEGPTCPGGGPEPGNPEMCCPFGIRRAYGGVCAAVDRSGRCRAKKEAHPCRPTPKRTFQSWPSLLRECGPAPLWVGVRKAGLRCLQPHLPLLCCPQLDSLPPLNSYCLCPHSAVYRFCCPEPPQNAPYFTFTFVEDTSPLRAQAGDPRAASARPQPLA